MSATCVRPLSSFRPVAVRSQLLSATLLPTIEHPSAAFAVACVAADGPRSGAVTCRNCRTKAVEIDLQSCVVGAEHAVRLRRRGACEQQKQGSRSHHDDK